MTEEFSMWDRCVLNKSRDTCQKTEKRNKEDARPFPSLDSSCYSTPNNNLKHSLAYIAGKTAHSDSEVSTMYFLWFLLKG